ncbi:hypothetical protein NicSoilB8_23390 [Arthrobacter sp. NicSoilB8]|nr:hypothetical protein NicSoilB8_23390 [Arthrobacter sp. NicSoilB8]
MCSTGQGLDVERLRVLPVHPVADTAQPREVEQALFVTSLFVTALFVSLLWLR